MQADAEAYAAPVPIKAFVGDWRATLKGGDNAFLDARVESGVRYAHSTLSYTWRYVYLLDFNEDTARVYYHYKNALPMQAGEVRQLDLQARHYQAQGLRFAQDIPFGASTWTLQLGFNALKAHDLTEGSLQGEASFVGGAITSHTVDELAGEINYHYSRPLLREDELDWTPAEPEGQGYSLDVGLRGSFSERLQFMAQVNDALGYLYWEAAPATRYTVACSCAQGSYDATGQLQVDARYRQRMPFSGKTSLSYALTPSWQGILRAYANPSATLASVGVGYTRAAWQGSLAYEPKTHAVDLRVQGKYAGLRWMADSLNSDNAHRLGLSLYTHYRW